MTTETTTIEAPSATETQEAPAAPSMEDTIRSTLRDLNARGETLDEPGEAGDEPGTSERQRGPDGRFAKQAAPEPAAAAALPVEPQPRPHDAYPKSWKPEHTESWKTLPDAVRAEVYRREQEFHEGLKQYKEPAAFGRAVGQHMLPHVETMRRLGTTPEAVTREVMAAWSGLVNGSPEARAETLLRIATQYGIDTTQLATARYRDGSSQAAPPATDTAVLQRLARLEHEREAEASERTRLEAETAEREITAFGSDPKHEHFAAVRAEMAGLLASGSVSSLEDAYHKAIWANAEVRAKLLAAQESARVKREAEEAAAARKAATTNVARRGTPPQVAKPGTIEDTIRAEWRRLNSG